MIHVPQRLRLHLEKDESRQLSGLIDLNLNAFNTWFEISRTPFFPDFTDHGPHHVAKVLETASSLIRDEAWEFFTPQDAAVLVLATILHDCAMHLTEDGFLALRRADTTYVPISEFGDREWPVLWEDFLSEASRFDGRTLTRIFGDPNPVHRPPENPVEWTDKHKRLIGEFVRRHHPRLAHEIALSGVPSPTGNKLKLEHVDPDLADLIGVVARSHGLPLRTGADYLLKKYKETRELRNVHAVFLMGLLRVSDYLQVESERAWKEKLQVSRLRSPIAEEEWSKHHAIDEVRFTHPDPEAVVVEASPKDVKTYFGIRNWLAGIQAEIDMSWAVFGEVYGEHSKLRRLGLTIRRVRSNLDDVKEFSREAGYVPVHATFEADPRLLSLVIEPLYDGEPEYGIRELLQNAVDAVRERVHLQSVKPDLRGVSLLDQPCDILMRISRDRLRKCSISVCDRGVGMTADSVVKYFLRAGASLRQSEAWKRQFEVSGNSRVLRSGRFGIGVLSAFLLGKSITVRTRSIDVSDDEGIEFQANIESDFIQLNYSSRPVGTEISIAISEELFEYLVGNEREGLPQRASSNDWYCWKFPEVRREIVDDIGGKKLTLDQYYAIPEENLESSDWRFFSLEGQNLKIMWVYDTDEEKAPRLCCNGIAIKHPNVRGRLWPLTGNCVPPGFVYPSLNVADPDGRFPLNLARNGISQIPEEISRALGASVIKDYLAFCLVSEKGRRERPVMAWEMYEGSEGYFGADTRSNEFSFIQYPHIVRGKEGYTVLDSRLVSRIAPSFDLIWIIGNALPVMRAQVAPWTKENLVVNSSNFFPEGAGEQLLFMLRDGTTVGTVSGMECIGTAMLAIWDGRLADVFEDCQAIKGTKYNWFTHSNQTAKKFTYEEACNLSEKVKECGNDNILLIYRCKLRKHSGFRQETLVSEIWEKYVGKHLWIPYSRRDRTALIQEIVARNRDFDQYIRVHEDRVQRKAK